MIYRQLATFYDALVKNEQATQAWVSFVKQYVQGTRILELACGSGEMALSLSKIGYEIDASDQSQWMLQKAKEKQGSDKVQWLVMDMLAFQTNKSYDAILCFCDSINYILKEEELIKLFSNIYQSLPENGVFLMDMHSVDRLVEFQEEYIETGHVEGYAYEWHIFSEDDYLYQNFAFYNDEAKPIMEQHIQRVYDPMQVKQMLCDIGFHVQIMTDFVFEGIQEGEKYFYICKKGD
ncbi:MAG: class I SAM-dependent methyltransferase [Erysipelotrichaceae bacterium]|nr:class I SAM-dependent methyltransferase [Erysipelotrichaceae bacterium]